MSSSENKQSTATDNSSSENKTVKRPFHLSISVPLSQLKKTNQLQLSRTTKVTRPGSSVENGDGEPIEFEISNDDLKHGDLLGRGHFGTVRKMYHEPSGMTFAVKMIYDNIIEVKNQHKDFKIFKLGNECPYLIKFYGALHVEDEIWILNEEMDASLDRFYLKTFAMELAMTESFVSKVSYSVLRALEFLRTKKVIHRDIKPSNILINASENMIPKNDDFRPKPSTDIWRLGISLFEIATGTNPYMDSSLSPFGILENIIEKPSPKLDTDKFTPDFCQFIDKCLLKDADERASCVDLLKEPFITKHEKEPIDLEFVKKVIDQIKKDPIEIKGNDHYLY